MVYTSPKLSALVLVAIPLIAAPLDRLRPRGAPTVAPRTGHARRGDGLRVGEPRRGADHAGLWRRGRQSGPFRRGHRKRLWRGARRRRHPFPPDRVAVSLAFCSVVFVLWLGARDVLTGRMSGGLLSQFVLFAVLGATSLGELSQVWNEVSAAAGSAGRIAELLAVKPRIVAPMKPARMPSPRAARSNSGMSLSHIRARLKFVSWKTSVSRLRRANGSRSSGPPGPASRLIFQLIMRFYDADEGQVLVDGVDVKAVDPKDLRGRIAPVEQEAPFSAPPSPKTSPTGARIRANSRSRKRRGELRRTGLLGTGARLCDQARRARRDLVRGAKAKARHRARHPQGRADPAARRSNVGSRRGQRGACPARARRRDDRPHHARDRASACDRAEGRPNFGSGGGPHRRGGRSRFSCRAKRRLCASSATAIRIRRDGAQRGECGELAHGFNFAVDGHCNYGRGLPPALCRDGVRAPEVARTFRRN